MEIIVVDFETYYDKDYSLSKITTEEYVNDPRFQVIMLGIRFPDGTKEVVTGTHDEVQFRLDGIDFTKYAVLAHNTMFDGAILSWVFGVKPLVWLDTLAMSRAMFGGRSNSLSALAKRYNLEDKLDTVHNMMGRRRESLSKEEFDRYVVYCLHDVDLCHDLFQLMSTGWYELETADIRHPFPLNEFRLIDALIRMYTEPALVLNEASLQAHLEEVVARKESILESCGTDKDTLMSNPRFAELLVSFGVAPPMKISPTTGKSTYAFAKTDPGLKDLLEHSDERVQAVVAARLGVKSTLEETRTERFIGISKRNKYFPIPLKYAAARTHRLGGADKINLQNLPARGSEGGKLKRCIEAPPGYVIIDCDSSNIEARGLAWLAEQHDLVADFAAGVDVYCKMATRIYNREVTKSDTLARFTGKTVILGCGYQTGKNKLQTTLKAANPPVDLPIEECDRIIKTYRNTYTKIPDLWKLGDDAIHAMHDNKTMWLGKEGVLLVEGKKGIKLPSGLYISYPSLHQYKDKVTGRLKWQYKDVKGLVDLYGGKLVENVVQALARIIVTQQLLKIAKRYKVVLTVHDAVACIVPVEEATEARAFVEQCMRWGPKWATGWPLNCESGIGNNYGEC